MWNVGQAPGGQTRSCRGKAQVSKPGRKVSFRGWERVVPQVWGQQQIHGLINHESVWIHRFLSPCEYAYLLEKHSSLLIHSSQGTSDHIVSPKSRGRESRRSSPSTQSDSSPVRSSSENNKTHHFQRAGIGVMVPADTLSLGIWILYSAHSFPRRNESRRFVCTYFYHLGAVTEQLLEVKEEEKWDVRLGAEEREESEYSKNKNNKERE